jgi:hypothetical protein
MTSLAMVTTGSLGSMSLRSAKSRSNAVVIVAMSSGPNTPQSSSLTQKCSLRQATPREKILAVSIPGARRKRPPWTKGIAHSRGQLLANAAIAASRVGS